MDLKQFIIDNNIISISKFENDYRISIYINFDLYEEKYYWEYLKEFRYDNDIILYKNKLSLESAIKLFVFGVL